MSVFAHDLLIVVETDLYISLILLKIIDPTRPVLAKCRSPKRKGACPVCGRARTLPVSLPLLLLRHLTRQAPPPLPRKMMAVQEAEDAVCSRSSRRPRSRSAAPLWVQLPCLKQLLLPPNSTLRQLWANLHPPHLHRRAFYSRRKRSPLLLRQKLKPSLPRW